MHVLKIYKLYWEEILLNAYFKKYIICVRRIYEKEYFNDYHHGCHAD